MRNRLLGACLLVLALLAASCGKKDPGGDSTGTVQLVRAKVGTVYLDIQGNVGDIPVDKNIIIEFSNVLDTASARRSILLKRNGSMLISGSYSYLDGNSTVALTPFQDLEHYTDYTLDVTSLLRGVNGETFPGVTYSFRTINGKMVINSITINGQSFMPPSVPKNISRTAATIVVDFSEELNPSDYQSYFGFQVPSLYAISDGNRKVTVTTTGTLDYYKKFSFTVSSSLKGINGFTFDGFSNSFITDIDPSFKYPLISDDELLDLVQQKTFRYFYDFAHPASGLARERNNSGDVVTTGGSGFGVMALIVAMERGFITRGDGLAHMDKILDFLETCDRYHGVWPHWLNGSTGRTIPFSEQDDGGDLVETSFLIQGLTTFRQYLDPGVTAEQLLINRINALWQAVEYDFFTQGLNALYWHWSPNYGFNMNMILRGYNETLICYVLGAGSPTHTISSDPYRYGYMNDGAILNGSTYYGITLPMGWPYGGPLFFTHYSFLGLDPRNLVDSYVNYWEQNIAHSLINWKHCEINPSGYVSYGSDCWGLTASDNQSGYSAHSPTNDLGVITPAAATSSLPYTPEQSMNAIKHFYYILGDRLWGEYGFYDAFNATAGWWGTSYLAIDQGPIVCMIENYRTGLLWDLFMSAPEVRAGLDKLGFTY
ncbi:MAG: glucoamylase family protein [Bacteroidales bacterium]|nr:glucoamylase family protein [Bacteroidales bacterium]MDT8373203.1 glucoamylase family protein [Bacteroidales bacterium]